MVTIWRELSIVKCLVIVSYSLHILWGINGIWIVG
jgi:hypothetical protein